MKFLIIDDEHELYRYMMADLFESSQYDVEEIKRVNMPVAIKKMHDLHYSRRANKFFEMPGKWIWDYWYSLEQYPFDSNINYTVIFMNGSLRNYYNVRYLKRIKRNHPNVRLCLLIFDKSIYYGAKRAINMRHCFDYVFSFDDEDCKEYGFIKFYNCFSTPKKLLKDDNKESDAFFIGNSGGRLKMLLRTFDYIGKYISNCRFYITAVDDAEKLPIPNVIYNQTMSFYDEMNYAYNSNCLIEVLREGQTGISLRVCEAIAFNKKLLTNNTNLKNEVFYDDRYMKIFSSPEEIDIDFITAKINVEYDNSEIFSPMRILDQIIECELSRGKNETA